MDKELKIVIPESLKEVNIAQMLVYDKIIKSDKEDYDKLCEIIASFNGIKMEDVKRIPIQTIDELGGKILKVLTSEGDGRIQKTIRVKGKFYGLEPDFDEIETGAYIDLEALLKEEDVQLHKIMAILYRPIAKTRPWGYTLEPYSTEDNREKEHREQIFLKHMQYDIVRGVVNFMLGVMES